MVLDALYCDVIVVRWLRFTGREAVLSGSEPADMTVAECS
jgi:hypothetical protein